MTASPSPDLHIFGIRHHGPGSARALQEALVGLEPDLVLVEGPPDANALIPWLAHPDLEPPVALIVYRPDLPQRAITYPFAVFSPEFQAIRYALARNIAVRFMDLPQAHQLALDSQAKGPDSAPLTQLAEAAGFPHYETWWNQLVEQRQNHTDLFEGILTMMQAARQSLPLPGTTSPADQLAEQREAFMRQGIRQARREGYQRLAVVCGAWHGPALTQVSQTDPADTALLADLPSVSVEAAWVPWTYSRLAYGSGYGAGIVSPGWYHHLWQLGQAGANPTEVSSHWLTNVANLLREERLDTSSAHIIEAVRLAEALTAIRGLALPGLAELNEATQTVLCFGEAEPMQLIQERLIVSERMGAVPPDSPMIPLQRNLYQEQKRLRLRAAPSKSTLSLDLRQAMHLERSHLLHRLLLLGVAWGKKVSVRGKKGTFREVWQLQWLPDFAVRVIEAGMWGNTVEDAAIAYAQDVADKATDLSGLTGLLDQIILADLPAVIAPLMRRIEDEASLSSDIPLMMDNLLPLARLLRYGSVRNTDQAVIQHVVDGLLTRICLGLPSSCASLDDKAAAEMLERLIAVHGVVVTMQQADHSDRWQAMLARLADQHQLHGLLAGRACRLLLDASVFSPAEVATRLARTLSPRPVGAKSPAQLLQAAFWIEGFLKGSGLLILHDQVLWDLLDGWVNQLQPEEFLEVLPLLRRTFVTFGEATRQQLSARLRQEPPSSTTDSLLPAEFNHEQAEAVLPLVARLLGIAQL